MTRISVTSEVSMQIKPYLKYYNTMESACHNYIQKFIDKNTLKYLARRLEQ